MKNELASQKYPKSSDWLLSQTFLARVILFLQLFDIFDRNRKHIEKLSVKGSRWKTASF